MPDAQHPIRVVLVDDQRLVRAGLGMVINSQPDLELAAEADNGAEALEKLSVTRCDVVLMDVRMPRLDGIETTRRLLGDPRYAPAPKVIVLTTFDLDEYALAAIKAGASGFLLKDAPPEELLAAVRTIFRGDAVIAPSTTRRLLDHVAPLLREEEPDAGADALDALTDREREVLVQMAYGLSNSEIAARFVVSEATVKTHVGRILAKLNSRDRVQAVVVAYQTGLVKPNDNH
ncbi:response regulator transcription factor [Phytoactinopolyspora alkaliphila]|uniref:Response regulator transcription factor n=1 Tax=Phytoactinopolyspora alkaliphila TaxID=1783498 RepID=A0A6N9YK72_9ACTN|nr:response regulator transcription factor [Phytoactinopolyspora alkaliphila]